MQKFLRLYPVKGHCFPRKIFLLLISALCCRPETDDVYITAKHVRRYSLPDVSDTESSEDDDDHPEGDDSDDDDDVSNTGSAARSWCTISWRIITCLKSTKVEHPVKCAGTHQAGSPSPPLWQTMLCWGFFRSIGVSARWCPLFFRSSTSIGEISKLFCAIKWPAPEPCRTLENQRNK